MLHSWERPAVNERKATEKEKEQKANNNIDNLGGWSILCIPRKVLEIVCHIKGGHYKNWWTIPSTQAVFQRMFHNSPVPAKASLLCTHVRNSCSLCSALGCWFLWDVSYYRTFYTEATFTTWEEGGLSHLYRLFSAFIGNIACGWITQDLNRSWWSTRALYIISIVCFPQCSTNQRTHYT